MKNYFDFDTDPIFLQHPPFTAYIANLSYDIDVEDVYKFFEKQNVTNIRLLRDGDPENGRLKGMYSLEVLFCKICAGKNNQLKKDCSLLKVENTVVVPW